MGRGIVGRGIVGWTVEGSGPGAPAYGSAGGLEEGLEERLEGAELPGSRAMEEREEERPNSSGVG